MPTSNIVTHDQEQSIVLIVEVHHDRLDRVPAELACRPDALMAAQDRPVGADADRLPLAVLPQVINERGELVSG